MEYTYEEVTLENFGNPIVVIKRSDDAWIPNDSANSDYQRYLRWLNGEDESGTLS